MSQKLNFAVEYLGDRKVKSPLDPEGKRVNFVTDEEFIRFDIYANMGQEPRELDHSDLLEKAGPRENLYFHPGHVHAGIVTCGGLCPGLNDVIRSIVRNLWYIYGVKRITGIQYGYRGFLAKYDLPTMELTPEVVEDIHKMGGSILGSSRGGNDIPAIVDSIERMNLNILFPIGGDGTQSGALAIAEEIQRRGLKVSVVGVPKTIDNDLSFIQKSFGFETAVSKAVEAVYSAHVEASDAINGIGVVKVMGRESGFIAAHSALASNDVNFCLIPEVEFDLDGDNGLLGHLKKRLAARNHAVILVAEGCGQRHLVSANETDESGNKKLSDIGIYIRDRVNAYFKEEGIEVHVRYIDPSYMIRSAPADPNDSSYCSRLGANAVHAAMAGKTKVLISLWSNKFVHLPMKMAVSRRNYVNPKGSLWRDVLETTRQPVSMLNE
ncbi:ATP-dependent 6-phosphofructokinase [Spirochaeta cellobiosiphila]|uniref:ATP-dependent 6-phosphofructokinase n=1 Tax=Spirochaeta cellobiosiphila TaxID=504483 RepID=UPI0004103200|nr:ATP-dependent 6-phosphofructokinase [Spirochaeta cellobiosiphila]